MVKRGRVRMLRLSRSDGAWHKQETPQIISNILRLEIRFFTTCKGGR